MGKQRFTSEVEVKGAAQAAKDFDKISKAQKGLTDKSTAAVEQTAKVDAATKQLTASESDFIGVLSRINPQLGGMADALLKGSKIAGAAASQNIDLARTFQKVSAAVTKKAGAFKLLLAGGAVVIGIMAIVKAIQREREELDKATEAVKRHRNALNTLKQEEQDRQQAIEDIADRRKWVGGLSADESRQALVLAESIGKQFEGLKPENINQVVGMLSGAGLSREEMVKAAALQ